MQTQMTEKPNGPVAAAVLAAGLGSLFMGLITLLSEISEEFAGSLRLVGPVGPLSGKVTYTMVFYALVWIVLAVIWNKKNVKIETIFTVAIGLMIVGVLLTLPPVWGLFGGA